MVLAHCNQRVHETCQIHSYWHNKSMDASLEEERT